MKINWLKISLIAGAGFALYEVLKNVGGEVGAAANSVGQSVANAFSPLTDAYVNATSTNTAPQGSVIFPDGTVIPVSSLSLNSNNWVDQNTLVFPYNGQNWQLHTQVNGSYSATPY